MGTAASARLVCRTAHEDSRPAVRHLQPRRPLLPQLLLLLLLLPLLLLRYEGVRIEHVGRWARAAVQLLLLLGAARLEAGSPEGIA